MINKKFLDTLRTEYRANESERRQIGSVSNGILFEAKKIIFALQREELKTAATKLSAVELEFKRLAEKFGNSRLNQEGSYRAAAEEYLEAKTLFLVMNGKDIAPTKDLALGYDAYLGGICDMIGELVRLATNRAAKGKFGEVAKLKKSADDTMNELSDFDMTGYLRTKYDQAKGHLRKLEQMAYEIKLRSKK